MAILNAAIFVPVTYMQAIDGYAYQDHGLSGTFGADAVLSIVACGILGAGLLVARGRRRPILPQPVDAA